MNKKFKVQYKITIFTSGLFGFTLRKSTIEHTEYTEAKNKTEVQKSIDRKFEAIVAESDEDVGFLPSLISIDEEL